MNVAEIYINSFFEKIKVPYNGKIVLNKNDYVVFESEKGIFLGQVVNFYQEKIKSDAKIIRLANETDMKQSRNNDNDSDYALAEIKRLIAKLDLPMSVVDSAYSLDKTHLYFSFVSEMRVDFRELVKRLAQKFHARIELRQIGVRDKAKKLGGLGPCGLMLCCNKFLNDFSSVSINMAKNQFLALNPSKINGSCGRLMCCLNYENDMYKEMKKGLPVIGNVIETEEGLGKVIDVDVFNRLCKVELPNKTVISKKIGEVNGKVR